MDESARNYTLNPQRGTDNDLGPTNIGIFKTFESARYLLDSGLRNVEVDYPQFYWEETSQYADSLGRNISKAVTGDLTSQQALDEAAEEWGKIVQKLGIDNQKRQHENFLVCARRPGYQICSPDMSVPRSLLTNSSLSRLHLLTHDF